jgi:hypothetical protein
MSGGRRRLFAPTVAVLALVGTWMGHSLEYVRVGGRAGLRTELIGSVHAYMLPVGAMLVGLAVADAMGWWRAWHVLGRGLDAARAALTEAFRGHPTAPQPAGVVPSPAARWGALVLLLTGLQLGLYVLQENLEAMAAGRAEPGVRVLLGVHAMAPLLHLGVAALLAALVTTADRLVALRAHRLGGVRRLLRVLLASSTRNVVSPRSAALWRPSPLDRIGRQLWRRPPPLSDLSR